MLIFNQIIHSQTKHLMFTIEFDNKLCVNLIANLKPLTQICLVKNIKNCSDKIVTLKCYANR